MFEKKKCFFTVNPVFDVKYAGQRETNVYLYAIVDLKRIETQKTHRTDEEFVQLIESVFPFFNFLTYLILRASIYLISFIPSFGFF